jgi:serine/threonine-protein kinase
VSERQHETQPPPEVGSTANSYSILAKLATGGMAELFLARNASAAGIERYVVLKRVLAQRAHDEAFVRMFLDEARLVAQLQHPNIAQVYDTGVLGDSYFFTMEYVHGETVRELIHRAGERKKDVPVGCALTITAAAAAGLHHAHERIGIDGTPLHIVHRDVSPSNLMVSYEGQIKLVDFGVAKANARTAETHSGTVKGKISYLSPEQCRGRAIDRRSDLFSLGIVTWELLAGERLFQRDTDYEAMDAIVKGQAPSLRARRRDVPAEVDALVQRLLAKEAAERYQNGDELVEAIDRIAVQTGLSLSNASLARFMRELFGQRPEPWAQMLARDPRAEAVTVTASPAIWMPAGGPEVTSAQLAMLPDISTTRTPWPESSADALSTTVAVRKSDALPRAPAPRRGTILVLSLAVVAALAVVVYLLVMPSGKDDDPPAAATPPVAAVAPSAPAPAPASAPAIVVDAAAPEPAPAAAVAPEPAPPEPSPASAHPAHRAPPRVSPADELARACHAHDVAKARHWLAQVPAAKRSSLIVQCELAGTSLDTPKPPPATTTTKPPVKPAGPDCDADPMACRH